MAMQVDRKTDERYNNWVKASLILYHVKQGIAPIAQDESHTLHNHLRQHVQQNLQTNTRCAHCKSTDIKRTSNKDILWKMTCPTCNVYLEELIRLHTHGARIIWKNTNPSLWSSDPWEVAKVFQPLGCNNQKSAQEADVAALLTFFIDCVSMNTLVSDIKIIHDVKAIRNSVMHSPNLQVSNDDLKSWSDKILVLLEDKQYFGRQTSCQQAVENIKLILSDKYDQQLTIEQEVVALQTRQEVSRQDVNALESLIIQVRSEMKIEIDSIKSEVTTAKQDIQKLDNNVEKHTRQLEEHDSQLKEYDEIVRKLCVDVENAVEMANKSRGTSFKRKTLYKRVNSVCTEIEADRANYETRQQQISEENRKIQSVTDTLDSQIKALKDLSETLQSSRVMTQSCTREDVDKDNSIKDMRQHLIQIYEEHCGRISISPMVPEKSEHVEDIYVTPSLEIIEPSEADSSFEQNETPAVNYRDIFFNESNGCKNIYITGEAGVGKSTFCKKMVNAWCRAHSCEQEENLSDDEQCMLSFQLLFYISLRSAVRQSSIEEMIKSQLLKIEESFLSNAKCLVLLDGLDEWKQPSSILSQFQNKDLPSRPLCNNCTFVTTCRFWKFTTLRLQKNEYDKHVKIHGLDEYSAEKLARCVIKTQNKDQKRDFTFEKFKKALIKQRIDHFMSVPLILLQLLCLWFDGKPFGNSHCEIYSNIIEHQLKYAEENRNLENNLTLDKKSSPKFPACFKNKKLCQKYNTLLYTLSELAFNTLCGKTTDIDDHSRPNQSAQIEACQLSGFLTRKTLDGCLSERQANMHFAHRTYHQLFAAVYIVMASCDLSKTFEIICTLDNFVEIPDLFVFVSGMDPNIGSSMLHYINESVAHDDRLHTSRRSYNEKFTSTLVVKLQKIFMDIFEENDNCGSQKPLKLSIEDIKVDKRNIPLVEKHLDKLKFKRLKSVQMRTSDTLKNQKHAYKNIYDHFSKSETLEKFSLTDSNYFIPADKILKCLKNTRNTLRSLHLEHVDLASQSKNISVIFQIANLESLCLRNIYVTHEQIEIISKFQCERATQVLKEVHLEGFRCLDHGPLNECRYSIHLSKHNRLRILRVLEMDIQHIQLSKEKLEIIQISNLLIPGIIGLAFTQLTQAPLLHTVQVRCCRDKEDVNILLKTLPTIANLKHIELSGIVMEDHSLSLFPTLKSVQFVCLKDVSITCAAFKRFIDSLFIADSEQCVPVKGMEVKVRLIRLTVLNEEFEGEFKQYIQYAKHFQRVQLENGVCLQTARGSIPGLDFSDSFSSI